MRVALGLFLAAGNPLPCSGILSRRCVHISQKKENGGVVVNASDRSQVSEPELIDRIRRGERHLLHHLIRPYERAI